MEVQEINPDELKIDPINERTENVGPEKGDDSLEESIREQGVIQPPVVRPDSGRYKVVVGQRRTLAAQNVGVKRMPVIVMDWDDSDALAASVTENVDAFRKSVSRTDRAAAVRKLMDVNDWNIEDVANELGVNSSTAREWLERTNKEWEDTVVHVDSADETTGELRESVDEVDDKQLASIRANTESKKEREEIVKEVATSDLSQRDVLEATKQARRSKDKNLTEVIEGMKKAKQGETGEIRVRTRVTFTGNQADGLKEAAKDLGTSEEEVVRQAIRSYLKSNKYI
jgi:ParB family chromosome partitioning protein